MHSGRFSGDGYVHARIYKQTGPTYHCAARSYDSHGFARQRFQFANRQVLLAKLDEVYPGFSRFADSIQQPEGAVGFIATQLRTIGDVVEKQGAKIPCAVRSGAEVGISRPLPVLKDFFAPGFQ